MKELKQNSLNLKMKKKFNKAKSKNYVFPLKSEKKKHVENKSVYVYNKKPDLGK